MKTFTWTIRTTCLSIAFAASVNADDISFNRDVRPILSNACFHCHGPDAEHREADLRLDLADAQETVMSDLVDRIDSDDPDLVMPPPDSEKSLTDDQKQTLKQWVSSGAKYQAYWAYVDPKATAGLEHSEWSHDRIDDFIHSKLRAKNLQPSPDADPATLIRRVTFDLTGLPPSTEILNRFLANPSQKAYREHVDNLLASPAFGERMAIYWLDLVRFADTVGYHGDQDHNISPYRDYVIDSFNQNMPLSQFTVEQLAGDLLESPTQDQLIATGYNRLLQTSHEGGVQPKEYLAIYAADRIRNLSVVWMGATVGCAQCHDHKYDPYTAKDFYALSAFFADLDEAQHFKDGSNSLPTKRSPEISVLTKWQRSWMEQIDQRLAKPNVDASIVEELNRQRKTLEQAKRKTMISRSISPRKIRVLPRGNWLDDSGEIVQPAVPHFMNQIDGDKRASRLDLARWLVDEEKGVAGLTSRVFVNRFWFLMFGRGLSSSLDDFGGQGEPPTHPELLDQLALDFVSSGWDIKSLLRRMALSRTYQQSSVADQEAVSGDPYNHWFARQSRFRLPAEMVRDCELQISNLLVREVGGGSVKPYQPAGYYRHLNFPVRKYKHDAGARQWRRGVYVHWQRQFLHPFMKAMDAPSREECTAQRPRSNTPLEALVLLNDPMAIETAVAMASLVINRAGSDHERLEYAFQSATSRKPDNNELGRLNSYLDKEKEHYRQNPELASALISSVKNGHFDRQIDPPVLASWASVMRAILNLYETVGRN